MAISIVDVAKKINEQDFSVQPSTLNPNVIIKPQGNVESPNEDVVYTRESIGYVQGYAEYNKRTGKTKSLVFGETDQSTEERVKSIVDPQMIDKHTNVFRDDLTNNKPTQDFYEDPTYLIFDVNIMKEDSALFNQVQSFMTEYTDSVPEIGERLSIYTEFINRLTTIFPTESQNNDGSGSKRHYIESIGGLDLLTKQIVDYPTDVITFTLTEDVAMTLQYLAELYNNLIYSYDTHRYLIPDNLLRFNIRITIKEVRNMKIPNMDNNYDGVNTSISQFIYVLHDCQFDFMETKNFTTDIKRGGFGAAKVETSAGGIVKMNYKSISKITYPFLINNSEIIDFREREPGAYVGGTYDNDFFSDGLTQFEYKELKKKNDKTKNNKFKSLINQEITDVRNVIINQIKEEASQLITKGQRWIGDHLGFTIGKTNVYYNNLEEKVTTFSFLFEDLLEKGFDKLLDREVDITLRNGNVYGQQTAIKSDSTSDRQSNNNRIRTNMKYPSGDVHPDGIYNEKYPNGDVNIDGIYNEKYPKGDVHPDGIYNEKYPEGDVNVNGQYNMKYPKGDVNVDGQYNMKYPSGDKLPNGVYNEKYPEGDVHIDGIYNDKYPNGNIYNIKYKSLPPNKSLGNLYKNNNL
jgi:hypothetical protein